MLHFSIKWRMAHVSLKFLLLEILKLNTIAQNLKQEIIFAVVAPPLLVSIDIPQIVNFMLDHY